MLGGDEACALRGVAVPAPPAGIILLAGGLVIVVHQFNPDVDTSGLYLFGAVGLANILLGAFAREKPPSSENRPVPGG
jgi:hypothetical protein